MHIIAASFDPDAALSRTSEVLALGVSPERLAEKLGITRDLDVSHVVHTSTSEVYGTAQIVPITEEHRLQGQSPYSASKIGADQLALSFERSFGTPVTVVRPFNTYGPRQSARAVIPSTIRSRTCAVSATDSRFPMEMSLGWR